MIFRYGDIDYADCSFRTRGLASNIIPDLINDQKRHSVITAWLRTQPHSHRFDAVEVARNDGFIDRPGRTMQSIIVRSEKS